MRINYQIRAPQVRVIGAEGNQLGLMEVPKAVSLAQEKGLDLVEVAPTANPPVCRIIDYGKYKFDQTKRSKEAKKKQKVIKVKEVKMGPNIDEHDYQFKVKHIINFLLEDCKVRAVISFRGRQIAHQEIGRKVMERILVDIKGTGMVEHHPKMEGRDYATILSLDPAKRQELKKGETKHAKDEIPPGSEKTV